MVIILTNNSRKENVEFMENNKMKNIVVLKNLPSNIVEEAIVFVKTNKYAKKLEYIDKTTNLKKDKEKNKREYIIKEAESVVSNYIDKMENKDKSNKKTNYIKKYQRLRIYSITISVLFIISILIH